MRITALFSGAALALAAVLIPVAPAAPAHAANVTVDDAGELKAAFDGATGTDYAVVLGDTFAVSAAQGPITVPIGATVTLDMNGESLTVSGPADHAGIGVNAGSILHIIDTDSAGTSHLEVTGGEHGAGIGSDMDVDPGKIIIDGVDEVNAQGGLAAAGIGGGLRAAGGEIEIHSGEITASGGPECGAGIGGGCHGDAGIITIFGGDITAEGSHDGAVPGGAGIGGAGNGKSGLITISGGTVRATGYGFSAGIGGGGLSGGSNDGEIVISGGTVTARGGEDGGAGIGSAGGRNHGPVSILGGIVTATGGCSTFGVGPGIGHSSSLSTEEHMVIAIHDADVIANAGCATGDLSSAAIGGAAGSPGAQVSITGGAEVSVSAPGSASAVGGGSGAQEHLGSLDIGLGADLSVDPDSSLLIPESATVSNAGALWTQGPFTNHGTVTTSGVLNVFDGVINTGLIENTGSILFSGIGSENLGIISNDGEIGIFDTLLNPGIIRGPGEVQGAELLTVNNFINVFDLNGGAGGAIGDETIFAPSFADALRSLPTAPTRAGFDFAGWNTASDGSGQMLEVDSVLGTSEATLTWFAQWQAQPSPDPDPTPDPTPDPGDDPDVTPVPVVPGADGELAQGGQSAPTTLIFTGITALLALGGTLVVVAAYTRKREQE